MLETSSRSTIRTILVYSLLVVFSVWFAMPFLWMISTSLKTETQLVSRPLSLVPTPFVWRNYIDATRAIPFLTYAKNTLIVSVLSVIGQVLVSSFVAYGFARIEWPGRDVVFMIVISTMMLPAQVTMIPLYVIYRKLGWINTLTPLWIQSFFSHPFNIFLLRQFFRTIPMELSEAARIDGCNEVEIYAKVIMPLCKPALATVGLFDFLHNWSDFQRPLIYLQDEAKYTLSLGLQAFGGNYSRTLDPSLLMAAATIMIAPAIILFFLTQKTFIEGIAVTGLKG